MDMNRLLGNIDGALDRALRSRKLEFQLMCAAAESRRAAKEIQDETSTEEEETEYEDGGKEDEKKTITTLANQKGVGNEDLAKQTGLMARKIAQSSVLR